MLLVPTSVWRKQVNINIKVKIDDMNIKRSLVLISSSHSIIELTLQDWNLIEL